jgi:hypothetical protein
MNRVLLGSFCAAAMLILTAFAFRTIAAPVSTALTGPAWTVSHYQLDRAFRQPLTVNPAQPISMQMTSAGGVIITQVRLTRQTGQNFNLTIAVNGIAETVSYLANSTTESLHDLNPPIIARPGDLLTLSADPNNGPQTVVIAGYSTLPGET